MKLTVVVSLARCACWKLIFQFTFSCVIDGMGLWTWMGSSRRATRTRREDDVSCSHHFGVACHSSSDRTLVVVGPVRLLMLCTAFQWSGFPVTCVLFDVSGLTSTHFQSSWFFLRFCFGRESRTRYLCCRSHNCRHRAVPVTEIGSCFELLDVDFCATMQFLKICSIVLS